MPKRKPKGTLQDTAKESSNAVDVAVMERPTSESELGQDQPAPSSESESSDPTDRKQFRSWVVDTELGYTRLTDEINRRIVLQFAEKPEADVLTAIKKAGFEFKPNYYGQKSCWVRRNDFEGRVHVENFEKLLKKGIHEPDADLPSF